MVQKIEGFTKDVYWLEQGGAATIAGTSKHDALRPKDVSARAVTVVVHEGKPERVFTESEVRAIMGPLVALSSARLNQITVKGVGYMEAENVEFAYGQLKAIAVRLGLYSDPT